MKTELIYLVLTAVLTGLLWIPVVVGYVKTRGPIRPADYIVPPAGPLPPWVQRAQRAHINAVENLAVFAPVVLAAQAAGVSTPVTIAASAAYFYARAAHALVHISGFSHFRARTLLFTVAWIAFLTFAVELLRHAG